MVNYKQLIKIARKAKNFAHAPYSQFRVGAALLTSSGKIITGCNIENSSYGLTICAERLALFKAFSEGITKGFKAIAIISDSDKITPPCGACRQVMIDLASNIDVILSNNRGSSKIYKLNDLLPYAFTKNDLL